MTVALPSSAQGSWQTYFGGRLNKASSSELDDDPTRRTGQTGNLRAPGFCLEVVQKTKDDSKLRSNLSPLQQNLIFNGAQWKRTTLGSSNHDVLPPLPQNLNFNGAQWKRTTLGSSKHDVTSQLLKLYVQSLQICIKTQDLAKGKYVHAFTIANSIVPDISLGNSLVNFYAKCGSITHAHEVFVTMVARNVSTWSTLISGYTKHGHAMTALEIFKEIQGDGIKPNQVTYVCVLHACTTILALEFGKEVHIEIKRSGYQSDVYVNSALVDMYCKCGEIMVARDVFDHMNNRNIVSWNSMLSGYAQHSDGGEALILYVRMRKEGLDPDNVTFVSVLSACSKIPSFEHGKWVHSHVLGVESEPSIFVGSALVDMYAKAGSVENAEYTFMAMPKRNLVSWNALLTGYAQYGYAKLALQSFQQMQEHKDLKPDPITFVAVLSACGTLTLLAEGKRIHMHTIKYGYDFNVFVGTTIVDMYAKCWSMEDARIMFDNMPIRNVTSWTTMIAGYVQYGEAWEGLELFESMERQGVKPNEITFANVLRACTHILDLKQGLKCHSILRTQGYDLDMFVASSLVAMYTKLGHIVDARLVFNNIHIHHRGHVVLWNSIIAGYAQHGHATEVFKLFGKMLQECAEPDDVTFVSILSACNHAGLVDEGCQVFSLMKNFYGIIPGEGHFVCMVDLLGHVGQLYESLNLIYKMPSEPSVMVWMALVGACRIHGNIELAESSVGHVSRLEPQNIESLILLSNMYAAAGRWGDRLRVRTMIENMGL